MVSQTSSPAVVEHPKDLGKELLLRVRGMPLVSQASSPGLVWSDRYSLPDSLANEVYSRYAPELGRQENHHLSSRYTYTLYRPIMRKASTAWDTPSLLVANPGIYRSKDADRVKPNISLLLKKPVHAINVHDDATKPVMAKGDSRILLASSTMPLNKDGTSTKQSNQISGDTGYRHTVDERKVPDISQIDESARTKEKFGSVQKVTYGLGLSTQSERADKNSKYGITASPVVATRQYAGEISTSLVDLKLWPNNQIGTTNRTLSHGATAKDNQLNLLRAPFGAGLSPMRQGMGLNPRHFVNNHFSNPKKEQSSVSKDPALITKMPINTIKLSEIHRKRNMTSIDRTSSYHSVPMVKSGPHRQDGKISIEKQAVESFISPRDSMSHILRAISSEKIPHRHLKKGEPIKIAVKPRQIDFNLQSKENKNIAVNSDLMAQYALPNKKLTEVKNPVMRAGISNSHKTPIQSIGSGGVETSPSFASLFITKSGVRAKDITRPQGMLVDSLAVRRFKSASNNLTEYKNYITLASGEGMVNYNTTHPFSAGMPIKYSVISAFDSSNRRSARPIFRKPIFKEEVENIRHSLEGNLETHTINDRNSISRTAAIQHAQPDNVYLINKSMAKQQLATDIFSSRYSPNHFQQEQGGQAKIPSIMSNRNVSALVSGINARNQLRSLPNLQTKSSYANDKLNVLILSAESTSKQDRMFLQLHNQQRHAMLLDGRSLPDLQSEGATLKTRSTVMPKRIVTSPFSDQYPQADSRAMTVEPLMAADMKIMEKPSLLSAQVGRDLPLASLPTNARESAIQQHRESVIQPVAMSHRLPAGSNSLQANHVSSQDEQSDIVDDESTETPLSRAKLELLSDKIWQKIQRKLTIERERSGL